jgi:PmbA protein
MTAEQTLEQLLSYAKKYGAGEAEASLNMEEGFSVEVRNHDVDTLEHHRGQGVQLTVFCDQKTASVGGSDLSCDALDRLAKKACTIASYAEADVFSGLADKSRMAVNSTQLALSYPWALTPNDAIAMGLSCEKKILERDARIEQCEEVCVSSLKSSNHYANSLDVSLSQSSTYHSLSASAIARDSKGMQRDSEYTQARDAASLQSIDWLADQTANKTLRRLGTRKIKSQSLPVVFHHGVAKSLIGHFTAAISGGNLYRDASFLVDALGTRIFPEHVSVYQRPYLEQGMGSAYYDSDGVKTEDLDYVRDGVVSNYVLSAYSARHLNMPTTGNANGVHNLLVDAKTLKFDALLKEMGTGLLITDVMGQGVNIVTGDYSRGAFGFWVENGDIQYPVEEITIASNLKDMFKNIVAMGDDIDLRGNYRVGSLLLENISVGA